MRGSLPITASTRSSTRWMRNPRPPLPTSKGRPMPAGPALFEAVRQKSLAQWSHRTVVRNKSDQLVTGLLFDDAGHRMFPTHATKAGVRYRYYVSTPCLHGEAKTASAGSVSRVPAADIEETIVKFLKEHLAAKQDRSTTRAVLGKALGTSAIHRIIPCSGRPKVPKYGGSKVGIPGVVRSNLALSHGRRDRKFWMQRRSAKNRNSNARTPAETKIRELSGRKSPQKRGSR